MTKAYASRPITLAVTGATGELGGLILPRLLSNPRIGRVIAADLAAPELDDPKLVYAPLDLSLPNAGSAFAQLLREQGVRTVVHLAFFSSRVRDPAYAHEVEAIGTTHVLSACVEADVKSVVMASTTQVYGASPKNPNFLSEERPLLAHTESRFIGDKIEAEHQVARYREKHPGLAATVLRFAMVIGPRIDTPFTRFLGRPVAPMVLGHDPLVQFVHEDDAADAMLLAALAARTGTYNIVGRGVLPLSVSLRLAGTTALPLPLPITNAAFRALDALGIASVPRSMLDYLRYLWVADGTRAERELGFKPRYSSREAVISFARARKPGRIAA